MDEWVDEWMEGWMNRKINKNHYRRIETILNCVLSKFRY